MSDRTAVDVYALLRGAANIDDIAQLAKTIAHDLMLATQEFGNAGGTGTMGEAFNQNYKPCEQVGMDFLKLLNDIIGSSGVRTLTAGAAFAKAESDANSTATPQK